MDTTAPSPSQSSRVPAELCGYAIDSPLPGDTGFLAIGPAGRRLTLKPLDERCLLRGLLHPSIHERLSRVRELPHPGVANFHGVGCDHGAAYLIWEFVDGEPFDQYALHKNRSQRELAIAARELVLAVGSLHLQGIVHGALVSGNILVSRSGSVRLTHISPMLFSDPAVDAESVLALLHWAVEQRDELKTALGTLIDACHSQRRSLRDVAGRLAAFLESRDFEEPPAAMEPLGAVPRRRSLLGAALVALAGIGISLAVWFTISGGRVDLPGGLHLPHFEQER
jgi:tRNA A-37 threonylcarbamoyl transferase component Bud32